MLFSFQLYNHRHYVSDGAVRSGKTLRTTHRVYNYECTFILECAIALVPNGLELEPSDVPYIKI